VSRVGGAGFRGDYGQESIDWSLYDLHADPGERVNVIDRYPEIVQEMKGLATTFSSDLEAGNKPMGEYSASAPL